MMGGVLVLVGIATTLVGALAAPAAEAKKPPPIGPLTLTPIDADAGYFLAQGTCPAKNRIVRYNWQGATNGSGWGDVSMTGTSFSLPLRIMASDVGGTVTVTLSCVNAGGNVKMVLGPTDVTSGNALIQDVPGNSGSGRRIVYSLSAQQVWVIEADETVVHRHLTSGRRLSISGGNSQLGTFKVYSKSLKGCIGSTNCPNMVRFHKTPSGNIGFHAIPFNKKGFFQTPSELGQPRSHGCVRTDPDSAKFVYDWAKIGDKVVVVP
jgi:hypothetical protein